MPGRGSGRLQPCSCSLSIGECALPGLRPAQPLSQSPQLAWGWVFITCLQLRKLTVNLPTIAHLVKSKVGDAGLRESLQAAQL